MGRPELDLPALSIEQRLSFSVNDILSNLEFSYQPELRLEVRKEHIILDGERSIHIFQTRISEADEKIKNIVQFMAPNRRERPLNQIASWYTGDTEFDIFTFKYTDDVERILQEVKEAIGITSQDG
ncbi:MAG TPA: hypothetical protein VI336_02845 [Candidatus Saccharimonadales bacterium]|nr:hypothetical protein [Candidatus Saccharimonadales bacterium]